MLLSTVTMRMTVSTFIEDVSNNYQTSGPVGMDDAVMTLEKTRNGASDVDRCRDAAWQEHIVRHGETLIALLDHLLLLDEAHWIVRVGWSSVGCSRVASNHESNPWNMQMKMPPSTALRMSASVMSVEQSGTPPWTEAGRLMGVDVYGYCT